MSLARSHASLAQVLRTRDDSFAFTVGESTLDARIREQADGSLFITHGHGERSRLQ